MTLKTVAERVGVSPMTVSNAFSRPDQLSAALREKILATAAELGYVGPDPAARTLARGATGTVGILFHGTPRHALSDEFSALFLAVIAEELGRGGLALTLLPNAGTADVVPVRDVAMDGAIVYSCSPNEDQPGVAAPAAPAARARRPAAARTTSPASTSTTVRARGPPPRTSSGSGTGGSRCSPPARRCVAAPGDWFVPQERMRGWRDVLEPAGIVPVVRYADKTGDEEGLVAARELLARPADGRALLLRRARHGRGTGGRGGSACGCPTSCRWSGSTTPRWRGGSAPR